MTVFRVKPPWIWSLMHWSLTLLWDLLCWKGLGPGVCCHSSPHYFSVLTEPVAHSPAQAGVV